MGFPSAALAAIMLLAKPAAAFHSERRLIQRLMEEANAVESLGGEKKSCQDLTDDDELLASNAMAQQYGLTSFSQTHDMLISNFGNADLLCSALGADACKCTCADYGEFVGSKLAQVVPSKMAVPLAPEEEGAYSCAAVRAGSRVTAGRGSDLLPDRVRSFDWRCAELGGVGVLLWDADEAGGTIKFAAEFVREEGGAAGIGVSANGGMFGADLMVVARERGADGDLGEWRVRDMFSGGYAADGSLVTLDDSQDVTLEWVQERDGRLAFVVSRPIHPCDAEDLRVLSGPMPIIWAVFPDHGHSYHGPNKHDRGTLYLDLLAQENEDTASAVPETAEDLFTVDMRMAKDDASGERYALPKGQVNTYACRSFELPSDRDYHVISYEAILDTKKGDTTSSSSPVHHIVVYSCDSDPGLPEPVECSGMTATCQAVEIAWAVGMPPQHLPSAAGLPLKRFVLMELHYENFSGGKVSDGSGLRLTFTPKLREHDFGYIIMGTDIGRTAPLEPGDDRAVRTGYCSAECLARKLPSTGFHVRGQFFHAHLHGRSLQTRHYRNGTEMSSLLGDMAYYDFNHQYFKHYGRDEHTLLPGDALVTTCVYDTVGRSSSAVFGLETKDEMCFNVVGGYPAIDLGFCWNRTATSAWCHDEWMPELEGVGGYVTAADGAGEASCRKGGREDGAGLAAVPGERSSGSAGRVTVPLLVLATLVSSAASLLAQNGA